jgi:hypothetical protein
VANAQGRRLERRILERIKKDLESSAFRTAPAPVLWYEQNRFVAPFSIFFTVVFACVAAVFGLRWALWAALPFGLIAAWSCGSALGLRKLLRLVICLIPTAVVILLFVSMKQPRAERQAQPATALHTEPQVDQEFITTSLTIDRSIPSIRQTRYSSDDERMAVETIASQWLVEHNKKVFDDDRTKLTRDLVIFSLIAFMRSNEAQLWEIHPHLIGGLLTWHEDQNRSCQLITDEDVRAGLRDSGNILAFTPIFTRQPICLPPNSAFDLSSDMLIMRNQKYELYFKLDRPAGVNYENPGTGNPLPKLPNGQSRFETRAVGIDVRETYFRGEMSDQEFSKYQKWGSDLVSAAKKWFEDS